MRKPRSKTKNFVLLLRSFGTRKDPEVPVTGVGRVPTRTSLSGSV